MVIILVEYVHIKYHFIDIFFHITYLDTFIGNSNQAIIKDMALVHLYLEGILAINYTALHLSAT